MQRLDVLPVLLQQRDQEVDGQMGVLDQVVLGHADVADGHGQAKDLLHLELDGGLDVVDLAVQVVTVGDKGRELAGPVQSRPEDPGNIIVITVNSILVSMINISIIDASSPHLGI